MAVKNFEMLYELLVERIHESMEYHKEHEHDDAWSEHWHGFRADELSSLLAFCEGMESIYDNDVDDGEDEQVALWTARMDELAEQTQKAIYSSEVMPDEGYVYVCDCWVYGNETGMEGEFSEIYVDTSSDSYEYYAETTMYGWTAVVPGTDGDGTGCFYLCDTAFATAS